MWEGVNSTWLEMQQIDEEKMHARGVSSFFDWVKERSRLFRGVTFGTMHRDDAYEFARLGTHVERADSTARILDVKYHVLLPSVKDVGGAVDYYQWSAVLRSVAAFEAYRKVYRDVITPLKLAELLILRDDTAMTVASDSRTNAGVDHIATFPKMRVYEKKDDRVIVALSSGNLAMTQGVINILDRQHRAPEGEESIWKAESMYDAASLVGDALREMQRRDAPFLTQSSIEPNANLLVGGQIKGEPPRLFHVYAQGNFIEATDDTPYFQLGESKYGKPILDRVISLATPQKEAAKCVLISFDSTMKSNISVGLPIDLLWYPRDSLRVGMQQRIREGDPYFTMLPSPWAAALRPVSSHLPHPACLH